MRKLSFLLVLSLMLCCFAACGNDNTGERNSADVTTTQTPTAEISQTQTTENTPEESTDSVETKVPETPQSDWTKRY